MKRPKKELPDVRNWVFVDAAGAPVAPGTTPIMSHVPIAEVGRIFDLIVYVQAQLDSCEAVESTGK